MKARTNTLSVTLTYTNMCADTHTNAGTHAFIIYLYKHIHKQMTRHTCYIHVTSFYLFHNYSTITCNARLHHYMPVSRTITQVCHFLSPCLYKRRSLSCYGIHSLSEVHIHYAKHAQPGHRRKDQKKKKRERRATRGQRSASGQPDGTTFLRLPSRTSPCSSSFRSPNLHFTHPVP